MNTAISQTTEKSIPILEQNMVEPNILNMVALNTKVRHMMVENPTLVVNPTIQPSQIQQPTVLKPTKPMKFPKQLQFNNPMMNLTTKKNTHPSLNLFWIIIPKWIPS